MISTRIYFTFAILFAPCGGASYVSRRDSSATRVAGVLERYQMLLGRGRAHGVCELSWGGRGCMVHVPLNERTMWK